MRQWRRVLGAVGVVAILGSGEGRALEARLTARWSSLLATH